ncbi:MAG: hypothetical protein ABSG76_12590 [Xanthobacteraceae bacterium]|jgi:hypothetical protein
MRALLKALGLAVLTIVGLVALFEINEHVTGRSAADAASAAALSPLYSSRLDEMQAQFRGEATVQQPRLQAVGEQQAFLFPSGLVSACAASGCIGSACGASGCAGSGCAGSGCGASGCGGSACGGSACVGSLCAGSACGGSACGGSACGGSGCAGSSCGGSGCAGSICGGSACLGSACSLSACVGSACSQSGCVGSACGQSGCVGSACKSCSGQAPGGDGNALAGFYGNAAVVPVSCPFGSTSDLNPVFVTGFNVERSMDGVRISWISTGADVREFHVLRRSADGTLVRVAAGPATSYQLSHVAIPGGSVDAALFLEIVDHTGWTTRVGSDGTTERIAAGGPAAGKVRADRAGGQRVL